MSVEIRAKVICDGCGASVEGKIVNKSTYASAAYWDAGDKAKKAKWITCQRYGPARHYCQACADTAPKKVSPIRVH